MTRRVRGTWRTLAFEFVVVVVGILSALAVDGWAEERGERAAERAYLAALAEDLAADTTGLATITQANRDRRAAAERILEALEAGSASSPDPAALAWDLNYAGYVTRFEPVDFTYRELIATGGLGLIRDSDLKRDIIGYYEQTDFTAQFYPLWHAPALDAYNPEVQRLVSPEAWQAIESSRGRPEDLGLDVDAVLRALRADGVIRKYLISLVVAGEQQAGAHEALKRQATELLNRLPRP